MESAVVWGIGLFMIAALIAGVLAAGFIEEHESEAARRGEESWFWRTHD